MIRVQIDFKDAKKFDNLIRYIENIDFVRLEAEVGRIADETVDNMKEMINSSRVRDDKGTHKLENSLDWDELVNIPGRELVLGIGNINTLKQEAPYYEMLNDGATYVTNITHTVPFKDTTKGQYPGYEGEFRVFVQGSSHTILGIHYIDLALLKLPGRLNAVVVDFGGKLMTGMSKASKGHAHGWGMGAGGAK